MAKEIMIAQEVIPPREVIVHKRDGQMSRALITGHRLDNKHPGYNLNAIGIDAQTRQKISLGFDTTVELGRKLTE